MMSSTSFASASTPAPTPALSRTIDVAASSQSGPESVTGKTAPRKTQSIGVMQSFQPITPARGDNSMATTPSTALMLQGPKTARLDISALISPPDAVYDSFSSSAAARILPKVPADIKLPMSGQQDAPPSPPISNQSSSPLDQAKHIISPTPSLSVPVTDPILFPNPETSTSPSRPVPLFDTGEQDTDRIIQEHIRATGRSSEDQPRPTEEEYREVLRFKSNVMHQFQVDRARWLSREKALLAVDRAARSQPLYHARPPAKPQAVRAQPPKPQPIRSNIDRVQKPVKGKEPRVAKQQVPRPIRTSPGTIRGTIRVSSTPEPRVRTVAPNREDKDFNSIRDFSPPLASLGTKSLRVDWKGNPLDLSKDPYAHLLHSEELKLAANLRLDCATYLTSKRRIFESRRNCLMRAPPKPFRKTDAQQACKIDVNKASKLWTAYDSVGWLDEKWVARD